MSETPDGPSNEGFAAFVGDWNRMVELKTPAHHQRMAAWLEERFADERRRMLLMAFRGSGKSTLVGLFAAWLLLRDPNRRLLVLAADLRLAKKMVRNVKRILERHPATGHLKPPARERDQWASDQFTVVRPLELRDPSMAAAGIGGNITGGRADVVICDDVEVPRNADTAAKRADLRERLSELDYVLVPGGAQLYIGTPHSRDSLYAEVEEDGALPFLDGFDRLVMPVYEDSREGIGEQRTYTWPERFGAAHVARIARSSGPAKFASQMLLRPAATDDGVLAVDRLGRYGGELDYREALGRAVLTLGGVRMLSASCWWDPSFARSTGAGRRGSDGSVVAALFAGEDNRLYLHRVLYLRVDPRSEETEADQQCGQVARFLAEHHLPAIHVETNGIGGFLPGLLRARLRHDRVPAAVVDEVSRMPKTRRILEAFDARLADRRLLAHDRVWETPFIREMRDWRPEGGYRGLDDGLDAVAGCLRAEPYRFDRSHPQPERRPDWRPGWRSGGEAGVVAPSDWAPADWAPADWAPADWEV